MHEAGYKATHEAVCGYEALLRNMKMKNVRFVAAEPPLYILSSKNSMLDYNERINLLENYCKYAVKENKR